jgi:hypothetical protein
MQPNVLPIKSASIHRQPREVRFVAAKELPGIEIPDITIVAQQFVNLKKMKQALSKSVAPEEEEKLNRLTPRKLLKHDSGQSKTP